jgi:type 1 glutamine amidotransferase
MKVLVICGDIWHPAEVVKRGFSYLDGFSEGKAEFDYICDAKDILTEEMLKEYQVIINAKGNQAAVENNSPWFEEGITEVNPKEFQAYIQQGGGFLALHAGNSITNAQCPEYTALTGSSFVNHPPRCDVSCQVVGNHPIVQGVQDFVVRDEHYNLELTTQDYQGFLYTSSEQGGNRIGGYVREIGKGRLCVLTPGHILSVYQNPDMQRLLWNAIQWCAGEV